jgi:hypothetical protein
MEVENTEHGRSKSARLSLRSIEKGPQQSWVADEDGISVGEMTTHISVCLA